MCPLSDPQHQHRWWLPEQGLSKEALKERMPVFRWKEGRRQVALAQPTQDSAGQFP